MRSPDPPQPELVSVAKAAASLVLRYTTRLQPSLLRAISMAKNWILVAGKKSFLRVHCGPGGGRFVEHALCRQNAPETFMGHKPPSLPPPKAC